MNRCDIQMQQARKAKPRKEATFSVAGLTPGGTNYTDWNRGTGSKWECWKGATTTTTPQNLKHLPESSASQKVLYKDGFVKTFFVNSSRYAHTTLINKNSEKILFTKIMSVFVKANALKTKYKTKIIGHIFRVKMLQSTTACANYSAM